MMRLLKIVLLVCLFFGCDKKAERPSAFLQTQQIKLAPPRVLTTSTIIDSSIVLSADFKMEDVKLRYTFDGTDPTENALSYKNPIQITEAGTYSFKAFHPEWTPSETTTVKIYQKGMDTIAIQLRTKASIKYPGMGAKGLVDHKKASLSFTDAEWIGFDTIAKARIDFGKKVHLEKITMAYLVDTGSWIFPPENVIVYLNKTDSIRVQIPNLKSDTLALADVEIPIEKTVQYLTIHVQNLKELPEWHPGKGLKAWLFMDEWIFN
ncbi:chitobiase/beta-hexosaminidase C-terminal domain-containing protein [Spongiivirga citrea]|uniref:Chitobiase/beta-hexosaminidase C-terminal domain-containing protein n=1 Tax=Spongiivirga citrea TaxID=1481457 RepID=A0A6M0CNZ5_9FLAO|nr:chitobiase/beta-hexosaminidase C-terminal domain-containing protein [Spongiivirga citrea]NER17774.1 hypothetical protein [Spongiivirga citrea]